MLLKQIYDGGFRPGEMIPTDPQYEATSEKAFDEIEYIASRLNDEDKERLNKMIDLFGEIDDMDRYACFACGFRSGIVLVYELFANDDRPLFHKTQSCGDGVHSAHAEPSQASQ